MRNSISSSFPLISILLSSLAQAVCAIPFVESSPTTQPLGPHPINHTAAILQTRASELLSQTWFPPYEYDNFVFSQDTKLMPGYRYTLRAESSVRIRDIAFWYVGAQSPDADYTRTPVTLTYDNAGEIVGAIMDFPRPVPESRRLFAQDLDGHFEILLSSGNGMGMLAVFKEPLPGASGT